ncbi:MAG: hypothetical protein IKR57_06735 [Bacilli bacterium]|nr:hypothetical protein [Bacilli bacterium]
MVNTNAYKSAVMEQMNEEEQFAHELRMLKNVYMRYLRNNIRRGHNGRGRKIIETESYQAYLYLAYKYRGVLNREEILRNAGFELDIENQSLKLVINRDKVLKNTL